MRLKCKVDFTGAPAVSRVNCKHQSSEIFARLTLVNKEMPLLLQREGISKPCSYVFIPDRQCCRKNKNTERGMQLNLK